MENITDLSNIKDIFLRYITQRQELFKIDLAIKLSTIFSVIILLLLGIMSVMATTLFLTLALITVIDNYISESLSLIVGGAIYLLLWCVIFLLRRWLILNPLVRLFNNQIRL